jgi:ubiquinone/menaquinone biosynthesis C-methylase UbiE
MDSYPGELRVWEAAPAALAEAANVSPVTLSLPGPHHPAEFAQHLSACEAFCSDRASAEPSWEAEPYSLQWFLNVENQRLSCRGRWIPRLLEFAKHSGETLLGLGNGLGTDWLQYARHGAKVVVCCPSASQLALIRRNFELRGLNGRFVHAAPTTLPLESASIDVACIHSLLDDVNDPRAVVEEVYRVLKPGGKVLAVTPARFHIDFWHRLLFFWQWWLWRRAREQAGTRPLATFTARSLRRLFGRFVEHRVYKRQLRRSDVPHVWRWAPMSLLERLMGRVLVVKAFKPLSVAITSASAA